MIKILIMITIEARNQLTSKYIWLNMLKIGELNN